MKRPRKLIASIVLTLMTVMGIAQDAKLGVKVANMTNVPQSNERIIFTGQASDISFSGISDTAGYFEVTLAAGDVYDIKIDKLGVEEEYNSIAIPALGPGEFFPFNVLTIHFEQSKSVELKNLEFKTGSSTILPNSFKGLDDLAVYLLRKADVSVEIGGHTDNVGAEIANQKLSEERAQSVRRYLIAKGVNAARLKAKGYGESTPTASNSIELGRQRNRRTELRVL